MGKRTVNNTMISEANRTHSAFRQPSNLGVPLWRYLDFAKLVSLLQTSSLYFCRIDQLDDPWEGNWPFTFSANEKNSKKDMDELRNTIVKLNRNSFVNCWCMEESESEAFWRIYAGNRGVAIKTTYQALFSELPSECFLGEVIYVNHRSGKEVSHQEESAEPFGGYFNALNFIMMKRQYYRYEREVRAVYWAPTKLLGEGGPGSAMEFEKLPIGVSTPIQISRLVQEVVVSPYAENYLFDAISAVVEKLSPGLRVRHSDMR